MDFVLDVLWAITLMALVFVLFSINANLHESLIILRRVSHVRGYDLPEIEQHYEPHDSEETGITTLYPDEESIEDFLKQREALRLQENYNPFSHLEVYDAEG